MVNRTRSSKSYTDRASDLLSRAKEEITAPRLIAAGAVAAGAGAYALLRDPERRDRLTGMARDYADRASAWLHETETGTEMPAAKDIVVP